MTNLKTGSNVAVPDDVYQLLMEFHHGKSDEECRRLNARLILLLVNHIGDADTIREAIALASASEPE
jgi:hypothetical protein